MITASSNRVRTAVNALLSSLSAPAALLLEMSHTVVRGEPNAAQLYLDLVLDEILSSKGIQPNATERGKVTLAEIIFHSLKKHPHAVYMINGATGERITNEYILKLAVAMARSISAKCPKGRKVMVVMRNHQRMVATYWATIFCGVLPFFMDPNGSIYELSYFLKVIEPDYVFCDREHYEDLDKANKNLAYKPNVVVCNEEDTLREFIDEFSDDAETYRLPESTPEASVMLVLTSGSAGYPKIPLISNKGLVAQLHTFWSHHTQFPMPTDMAILFTTAQWLSFTMVSISTTLYQVPLLLSPNKTTIEHATEMIEKFRPTWAFLGPAFAKGLLEKIKPNQASSLKTVVLAGAPVTPAIMSEFKAKLPNTAQLCNYYGATETHGFIATADGDTPVTSNGRVANVLYYKLLDESGAEVKPGNNGELYVKGECVIQGYYKNNDAYNESFKDGWYRTGDWMHLDENERLHYLTRRNFSFRFGGNQICPEEVEEVIDSVKGVHESIVCGTDEGPAAAVVLHPNCTVTREQIHDAVNSKLPEYKRLHGGLVFVEDLPRTHSGKLRRGECKLLIHRLTKGGDCF